MYYSENFDNEALKKRLPHERSRAHFANVVRQQLERGMVLPFTLALVGTGGSALTIRYAENIQRDKIVATVVARSVAKLSFPVHVLFVDSEGVARQLPRLEQPKPGRLWELTGNP